MLNIDDNGFKAIPDRVIDWMLFSEKVKDHLLYYTVPQYGDKGEDCITNYSIEECIGHIEKYAKRYGSQSREGQQELDFMKIAHYAQCAYEKYINLPKNKYTEVFVSDDINDMVDKLQIYMYEEMDGVRCKNIKVTVEVTEYE